MNPHSLHFRKEVVTRGNRREIHLYFQGRLIYKQWQLNGLKVNSRFFYEGEGLAQSAR